MESNKILYEDCMKEIKKLYNVFDKVKRILKKLGTCSINLVALKQNKNFIEIELNSDYTKITEKRLQEVNNGLSNSATIII